MHHDDQRDGHDHSEPDEQPTTEELQEPSTEKEPAEAPTAPPEDDEPSHLAVGIGIVGRPQVEPEPAPEQESAQES